MIVTDLNDRERKRFAEVFDHMERSCGKLAAALRAGNDMETLVHLVTVSLSGSTLNELAEIMKKAVDVKVPDCPPRNDTSQRGNQ